MAEQKNNVTDEQLAQALRQGKGGRLGGKLLSLVGVVVSIVGIILGGNIVVILIGGVILALGQTVQGKSKGKADRQAFEAIVPGVVGSILEDVQVEPGQHILSQGDTNIPVPTHTDSRGEGYVRGTYKGLTVELCTVRMTDVDEVQREETGLWERNEREVYAGQWMLCELGREFPTWLTIWPRGKLEKLLNARTIKTGDEAFDRQFNLSSGDEAEALRILSASRLERLMRLADTGFGKYAVNLNTDGKLYIAVHSGRGFFDTGKGRESPEQLRQRFAGELKWFTGVIDTFRPL